MTRWQCYRCKTIYEARMGLCWRCGSAVIGPAFQVPASKLDGMIEIASARELWKRDFNTVEVPSYPQLLICVGALLFMYGPPGSGKSTMATRFLLKQRGVYIAAEEGIGGALASRVKRVGLKSEEALFVASVSVDGLIDLVRSHRPDFVVIDSLSATTFHPTELRRMLNTTPMKAILALQQLTKSGEVRGTLDWVHEADVVIRVDEFAWKIEKSRYQAPISGEVMENAVVA